MSNVELKAVEHEIDSKEEHWNRMKVALYKELRGWNICLQDIFKEECPENDSDRYLCTESHLSEYLYEFTETV